MIPDNGIYQLITHVPCCLIHHLSPHSHVRIMMWQASTTLKESAEAVTGASLWSVSNKSSEFSHCVWTSAPLPPATFLAL